MDKDKILEKSRKENKNQDTMERTIAIQGMIISLVFLAFYMVKYFTQGWWGYGRPVSP